MIKNLSKLQKWIAAAMVISGLLLVASPVLAFGRPVSPFNAPADFEYSIHGAAGRMHGFVQRSYNIVSVPMNGNANLTQEAETVATQAAPAVVSINAYKDMPTYITQVTRNGNHMYITETQTGTSAQEVSSGSGFFISSSGYILTNKHVVADTSATYMVNYTGNSEVSAQVVWRDPNNDLAIVKIDGSNFSTITLGDSSNSTVGESVVAIGNALGKFSDYATQGNITALNRNITVNEENGNSETLQGVIQTSAKLYPGDSGGPLLNMQGQVLAINTATVSGGRSSAGFSIPVNVAKNTITNAGITL